MNKFYLTCWLLLFTNFTLADNLFETTSVGIKDGYSWFVITDKEFGRVKQCRASIKKSDNKPEKPQCSEWLELLGGK